MIFLSGTLIRASTVVTTHPADRHLVGGESACLVRAYDRGAAKSLDGGEAADNGILASHAPSS